MLRQPYEFEVQGVQFQARRMSPMVQMQVMRRVTPVLMGVVPAMLDQMKARQAALTAGSNAGEETEKASAPKSILDMDITVFRDTIVPALQNAAVHLAGMPDDEFQYVMRSCLELVSMRREGGTGWIPIWNQTARQAQFEDIDGSTLLLVTVEVLRQELSPFMTGLVSSL